MPSILSSEELDQWTLPDRRSRRCEHSETDTSYITYILCHGSNGMFSLWLGACLACISWWNCPPPPINRACRSFLPQFNLLRRVPFSLSVLATIGLNDLAMHNHLDHGVPISVCFESRLDEVLFACAGGNILTIKIFWQFLQSWWHSYYMVKEKFQLSLLQVVFVIQVHSIHKQICD